MRHTYSLQGEVTELCVDTKGLKEHATKLQRVLKRYQDRVQWLNRGRHGVLLLQSIFKGLWGVSNQ